MGGNPLDTGCGGDPKRKTCPEGTKAVTDELGYARCKNGNPGDNLQGDLAGNIIGTVIGGVAGFCIGGPPGAVAGGVAGRIAAERHGQDGVLARDVVEAVALAVSRAPR